MKKAMDIIGKVIIAIFIVAVIGLFVNTLTADATARWAGNGPFHHCDREDCDGYYQVNYKDGHYVMHEDEMNEWAMENNLRVVGVL